MALGCRVAVAQARICMIRVRIADDEPLARSGLRAIVGSEPDLQVVGEAEDGVAAVAAARRLVPDVVLMDVRMPRVDGIRATQLLAKFDVPPAVLIVTTFENDEYVYDALRCGARGFLLKRSTADQVVTAIRTVYGGDSLLFPAAIRKLVSNHGTVRDTGIAHANLTAREQEVLRMMARGLSYGEIAEELVLGVETIKTHVRSVLAKLGVRDRVQAVIVAYESGFIPVR
jgi:DNA-binding NarL/FixJ family response regulator